MFSPLAMKTTAVLMFVAIPAAAAGTGTAPASSDEPPPTAVAPADTNGTEGVGSSEDPALDMELEIDILLGLVPEDEMQAYFADQSHQQELQVQACMSDAGFEYNLEDTSIVTVVDRYSGMTQLEFAEQWGFGVWTTINVQNSPYATAASDWPNDEIVNRLDEAGQAAWFEVGESCRQQAISNPAYDPRRNPMVQQAVEDFNIEVETDPRVRAALEAWVDCMADAGHPFDTQQAMVDAVFGGMELRDEFWQSAAWDPNSPDHARWQDLVEQEIDIAVADATCSPPLEEVRVQVRQDLRPGLVAVWQTIDWTLPPVTYFPGEDEVPGTDG